LGAACDENLTLPPQGFGRIGRLVTRAALANPAVQIKVSASSLGIFSRVARTL